MGGEAQVAGVGPRHKSRKESAMTFGVVVFPGSNCEQDAHHAATARTRPAGTLHLAQGGGA